jgi:hypothetical protein
MLVILTLGHFICNDRVGGYTCKCLMPLSSNKYFSYIIVAHFIGVGNQSQVLEGRKPLTSHKLLTNFITECCNGYNSSHELCSIQHYVIKFLSDLRQFCGFLRILLHQ